MSYEISNKRLFLLTYLIHHYLTIFILFAIYNLSSYTMKLKLSEIPTRSPKHFEKEEIKKWTIDILEKIGDLQNMLYAERKQSILLVLQGMDGSGKDGITRALFSSCSPVGVQVYAFKKPTEEEFAHDFLWRAHKHTPEKGMIQVFNRSHYEDILIHPVHGWIDDEKRDRRMKAINAFEENLRDDCNTTIVKFYLHISPEEQLQKLTERTENPKKFWKHNDGDWAERKLWDKYSKAYEYAMTESTIPWHIIPCDQEWYRDYVAAKFLLEILEGLKLKLPPLVSELFKK
jgi:PPK2 family polyphosphate:nucleotide phosphotransferase